MMTDSLKIIGSITLVCCNFTAFIWNSMSSIENEVNI
jgi:hypothetical protein